jgi:hypothetical protein
VIHALPTPGGLTPDRFMADIIARGDTVLLVGIRPGNLPTVILEHPQVCYWPSDSRQMSKGTVPVGTGAVLFSKWLSHTEHRRIRAQAEKVGAYCPAQLLGTGEMRVLLTSLVPRQDDHIGRVVERLVQEAPHPSAPPAREEAPAFACECGQVGPGIAWGGSTREFVERHWLIDPQHTNGWQMREAERLHRLAGLHGLSTSLHYLQSLVSQLNASRGQQERDEARLTRERAEMAQHALAAAQEAAQAAHAPDTLVRRIDAMLTEPAPEPVAAPPEPTAATVKADEQRLGANLSELVRMLDDASAVLSLARETVLDLAQQNAKLQQSRDQLRARVNRLFDEG